MLCDINNNGNLVNSRRHLYKVFFFYQYACSLLARGWLMTDVVEINEDAVHDK